MFGPGVKDVGGRGGGVAKDRQHTARHVLYYTLAHPLPGSISSASREYNRAGATANASAGIKALKPALVTRCHGVPSPPLCLVSTFTQLAAVVDSRESNIKYIYI